MFKKTIAISVGDINGVGIQLALENHKKVSTLCNPIYCINKKLLKQASKLLCLDIPKEFRIFNTKCKILLILCFLFRASIFDDNFISFAGLFALISFSRTVT